MNTAQLNLSCGSNWNRWDLHFHTPSSFDYENNSITNSEIVDRLRNANVKVVAITDHHQIDIERIRELRQLAGDTLTILPGIELRDDHGNKPVHYICIFSEECDLEHVWTTIQGQLQLTDRAIAENGGDEGVYVPIAKGATLARELGGIVTIHAGAKSNSIEQIENTEQFQKRIKYNITNEWVDIMEIGQIKDIDRYHRIVFPQTGLERPLIVCSDNHDISSYEVKVPQWIRAETTFRGLQMALQEPRSRFFIGERPQELIERERNPTRYIKKITFRRKLTAPSGEQWFQQEVNLNSGLVAIIGNKGSGKSALADVLGLLGSSKNSDSFSFLNKKRFLHPLKGFAQHFDATIVWCCGEELSRSLSEDIKLEEVERIKYLPQDYVEKLCNELSNTGEKSFEQELKAVIFSHVPDSQRLGQPTLDGLVRFQTDEKQKRIDFLLKQLRQLSRERAVLEIQRDPSNKLTLEEKLERQNKELEVHNLTKPKEETDPNSNTSDNQNARLLADLATEETAKKSLEARIEELKKSINDSELKVAVAARLIEKIDNFEKEFEEFQSSLNDDAGQIGVSPSGLVSLVVDKTPISTIHNTAKTLTEKLSVELDLNNPESAVAKLYAQVVKISTIQSQLDAPNRLYQAYLKELAEWEDKRKKLIGDSAQPESIEGLKAAIFEFDKLPDRIREIVQRQIDTALQIHKEKKAQSLIYSKFYGPVQNFIDTHELARSKLQLEFKVELVNDDFSERLLALLAQNRKGSFMGVDEGQAKAQELTQNVSWDDENSVGAFLQKVDEALHFDHRDKDMKPIQLSEQLVKGRKIEELFDLLYGLEFIRPRYILRWEGKDLSVLSPGERGTLLLIFYLLIDKGDMPLIIDQPEGNLDNQTVAKVLIDCIREARKRRQVFLVTHNPNLAVVCDADQVIYSEMVKSEGNVIRYLSGALENPETSKWATDVLEGTRWAFDKRSDKYDVGSPRKSA